MKFPALIVILISIVILAGCTSVQEAVVLPQDEYQAIIATAAERGRV